ncbi:MAG: chemotaxis protein CheW [Magnetococcales bacterium]|nr:chemotaxis protein CheW [Magnetococcales bacterium]
MGIGEERFAVEVGIVREILDSRPIARLPNAPPFLCGVIDVRGCTVPVVDLRIKLGLAAVPATDDTRILVVDLPMGNRNLVIGMQVDRVIEVADFATESLETAPDIGVPWKSEYIQAIGRLHGNFVVIFDMQHLFGSGDMASLHPLPAQV